MTYGVLVKLATYLSNYFMPRKLCTAIQIKLNIFIIKYTKILYILLQHLPSQRGVIYFPSIQKHCLIRNLPVCIKGEIHIFQVHVVIPSSMMILNVILYKIEIAICIFGLTDNNKVFNCNDKLNYFLLFKKYYYINCHAGKRGFYKC